MPGPDHIVQPLGDLRNPEETKKIDWPLLLKPNGEPVPKHQLILKEGEEIVIKDYTYKVAHVGESYLVIEPIGPIIIGENNE